MAFSSFAPSVRYSFEWQLIIRIVSQFWLHCTNFSQSMNKTKSLTSYETNSQAKNGRGHNWSELMSKSSSQASWKSQTFHETNVLIPNPRLLWDWIRDDEKTGKSQDQGTTLWQDTRPLFARMFKVFFVLVNSMQFASDVLKCCVKYCCHRLAQKKVLEKWSLRLMQWSKDQSQSVISFMERWLVAGMTQLAVRKHCWGHPGPDPAPGPGHFFQVCSLSSPVSPYRQGLWPKRGGWGLGYQTWGHASLPWCLPPPPPEHNLKYAG